MLEIMDATGADVPVILELIRGLAEYEKLAPMVVASEEALRGTLFGARRYAEVLIARCDGKAAGFALFFHNYSTFLARPGIYLEDLFVMPEHRRQGIGLALLRRVARLADERGCGRMEWAVLDWNQPALDFYARIGAQAMDEWRLMRMTKDSIEKLARG